MASTQVAFTEMRDGTSEDFVLMAESEAAFASELADRVMRDLRDMVSVDCFQVSRLDHSLQTATRALRDGADDDWVFSALLHDIGDSLAPENHGRFAAEIIRPYVRSECCWTVEKHEIFQRYYYGHHLGQDRNARDKYRSSPYYESCVAFCEQWDQKSFDPAYDNLPLSHFEPLVRSVFARGAFRADVMQDGVALGCPSPA